MSDYIKIIIFIFPVMYGILYLTYEYNTRSQLSEHKKILIII